MLKLTNTLSGKKEEFVSIKENKVGMYNCGPTVYDFPHIGNLRKYVFDDILRRTLEFNGYQVHQVINITDFGHLSSDADEGEDKMTKGLLRDGKPLTMEAMKELANFYTEKFIEDIKKLNIEIPEIMPKASEHIREDIDLIKVLERKGFTYQISDGVYFDTSKFPEYGKLGGINLKDDEEKSRIGVNTKKKNSRDFAVWKLSTGLGFPSPWGNGFPGWHIECSAMSMKYLGETFDIHTGGIDHIPVHHNNEIAQSEAVTGKKFVNYWLHENFLNINDTKISKSLSNGILLQDLLDKNIDPLAYRYWLLTAHYKSTANFSWETIVGAETGYRRLIEAIQALNDNPEVEPPSDTYLALFKGFINDDLDTPKAIALMWDLLKDDSIENAVKKATLLEFDKVLGLKLDQHKKEIITPEEVRKLVAERELARKNKEFNKSDELRDQILKLGFEVKDTPEGPVIF